MKRYIKRFRKLFTSLICCSIIALNISFLSVYAANATATLTTALDSYFDSSSGTNYSKRIITVNIDGDATGYWYFTPTNNNISTSQIVAYNCEVRVTGSDVYVYFEHTDFMYIEIYSYNPGTPADIQSWSMVATLDDDPLQEIIYREGIIYAELLDLHQMLMENFDTYIDTISWTNIPLTFKGWTSSFSSYDTRTNRTYNSGYYTYNEITNINNYIGYIFKFDLPIKVTEKSEIVYGMHYTGPQGNQENTLDYSNSYRIVYADHTTVYFIVNPKNPLTNTGVFYIHINGTASNLYTNYQLKLDYISPNDIEYWNLYNHIQSINQIHYLEQIANGSSDTAANNTIDSITSDLNDQISDSNAATSSTENILQDFNQNLNLNSYAFDFSNMNGIEYFKLKLTNIYDINEFKPFYIIPIILFILGRILAG